MWWHYIFLLFGIYLVASSLYNIVINGNPSGWIVNGVSVIIGVVLTMWSWGAINTPPPMSILGGGRRRW
jgi:hypothetical protein